MRSYTRGVERASHPAGAGADARGRGVQAGRAATLAVLAERVRPAGFGTGAGAGSGSPAGVIAPTRVVPVPPALAGILPDGGLRRGTTVALDAGAGCGSASTALAGALLAGASGAGTWCAVVGMPELGLAAVEEMGADLARVVLVPAPGRAFPSVAGVLLDAVDLVLVGAGARVSAGDARRLAARARERDAVLVTLAGAAWPVPPDLRLVPVRAQWQGLGEGSGRLTSRLVEVEVGGRRAAARARRTLLWLPSARGTVEAGGPAEQAAAPEEPVPMAGAAV